MVTLTLTLRVTLTVTLTLTLSLQLVWNAAARLLTRTRKFDHITPILASLHWLTITSRSDFKVLLLTYKALHGLATILPEGPHHSL